MDAAPRRIFCLQKGVDKIYTEKKPLLVTRSSLPPLEEYVEEIRSLWETRRLTNRGEKLCALEQALREALGLSQLCLVANGHTALQTALCAMGLCGEVITTPFTFASTAHAIVNNGLTPVFGDIEPQYYTLNPAALEPLITRRTCAIVATHVYGSLCDVEAIEKMAEAYHLKVVYDAAHAFGVSYKGKSALRFGDASAVSLHATKVFHTAEGGLVVGESAALTDKIIALTNFGITGADEVAYVGANGKMSELCAALGLCNLRHFEEWQKRRAAVCQRYRQNLGGISGILLQQKQKNTTGNSAYVPVVFDGFRKSREEVRACLAKNGIFARRYFYPVLPELSCYAAFREAKIPVARRIAAQVLALPVSDEMTAEEVDRVCEVIVG